MPNYSGFIFTYVLYDNRGQSLLIPFQLLHLTHSFYGKQFNEVNKICSATLEMLQVQMKKRV